MDLSASERARCAERLGLALRTAPRVDAIPAEKRAYYDAVAATYAQPRAPPGDAPSGFAGVPRSDLLANKGGVYIPVPRCVMPLAVPTAWKAFHEAPPHGLKLGGVGRLNCFAPPPSGRFFEELDSASARPPARTPRSAAHLNALDAEEQPKL